jgi:hypothetical protein
MEDSQRSKTKEIIMKAKEFIPASKPRNFVAKNAPTSGAGRHKDSSKKKDLEQGKVKHKKDLVPMEDVAEAQLDEAPARDVLLGLLDKFYADMKLPPRQGSHSGALDIKSPGTKVWTRGDGTRLRDPGRIQASHWADDKKQAEKAASKFWPWLLKQPGVKSIGQVSGQFGSSPMTDAVSYKGLYFSGGPYGTEFGSMSRVKNPKSVWRHKPFELEPKAEQGVAEGWSDKYGGVMRPPTPYSVYIKGKKWKDFENDDHARAVMDKLKAKFKADGRDPETITIAPTEIITGEATALEKFRKAADEREKKHDAAEKEMKARHASGKEDMKGSIDRLEKHLNNK